MAWDGKGLVTDLNNLPDYVLDLFTEWRNERVTEENESLPKL